jgi:hypothetical protein
VLFPRVIAGGVAMVVAAAAGQESVVMPLTIEALRDVPVKTAERRADGAFGQERGVLYSHVAFVIPKGERFRMIEQLGEGGCRVEIRATQYVLSSCPWLPGFADRQLDVFQPVYQIEFEVTQ